MEPQSFFDQLQHKLSGLLDRGGDIPARYEAIDLDADAAQKTDVLCEALREVQTNAETYSINGLARLATGAARAAHAAAERRSLRYALPWNGLYGSIWDEDGQWTIGPCEKAHFDAFHALVRQAAVGGDLMKDAPDPLRAPDNAVFVAWLSGVKAHPDFRRDGHLDPRLRDHRLRARRYARAGAMGAPPPPPDFIAASIWLCGQLGAHAYRLAQFPSESPAVPVPESTPEDDLAGEANPTKEKAPVDHRPPAQWTDVTISFLSDHRVQITIGDRTWSNNYADMGFEDRRTRNPNSAWVAFRELAKKDGSMVDFADAQKVKKQIQKLRQILRQYMAREAHVEIPGDPLPYIKGTGYRAAFKIDCGPSFDS